MASIDDLKQKYLRLDQDHEMSNTGQINENLLMAFDYDYQETDA